MLECAPQIEPKIISRYRKTWDLVPLIKVFLALRLFRTGVLFFVLLLATLLRVTLLLRVAFLLLVLRVTRFFGVRFFVEAFLFLATLFLDPRLAAIFKISSEIR